MRRVAAGDTHGRGDLDGHDTSPTARAGRLAAAVFLELQRLGGSVLQDSRPRPFAVVAADDRLVAGNRPLFELLGCHESDLLGTAWPLVMETWGDRGSAREFDAHVRCPQRSGQAAPIPARVSVQPVLADGEVVAHTVLFSTAGEEYG